MGLDILTTHALTGLGGIGATVGAMRVWPSMMRWFSRRADRQHQLELKKMEMAVEHEKVEVEREKVEIAHARSEVTGKHQAAMDIVAVLERFNEKLGKRLDEAESGRKDCEAQQKKLQQELNEVRHQLSTWEERASTMELTFQATVKQADDCERERAIDRKRMNALEHEMRDLRSALR
jgi:chromosome segregation ATPase